MRILRGQSNVEVSSKGFAFFVLGLILATFFGGAVRTVLNSGAIQKRFLEEVQSRWPDVSIEMGSMRGQLSRGIWPGLAFHFENLRVTRRSCRGNSILVEVDHLEAPLKLLSLWKGPPKLGDALARGLKVNVFRQTCLPSGAADNTSAARGSDDQASAPMSVSVENQSPIHWAPLRQVLESLEVDHVEFTSETEPTLKTVLHNLIVDVGDHLALTGDLEFRKSVQGAALIHQMSFQADADESQANLNLRGKFKEGSLQWNVKVDLRDRTFHQEMVVHQVPTKDLLAELFHLGLLHDETILKSFWLTCNASQDGTISNWKAQPVRVSECLLDGTDGKVELKDAQVNLNEKRLERPATLQVTQMQLGPLLEVMRRDTMSKVFSRLGAWSGQVEVSSFDKWSLSGLLSNLEIIFSSQSVRGKQVVNSVRVELARDREEVKGRLSNFDLLDGEVQGEARLQLDPTVKSGRIELEFSNFSLSSGVQRILIGGRVDSLQISGEGRLLDGALEGLSLTANSKLVEGQGWKFSNLSTQLTFKNSVANLKASARELVIDESWGYFATSKALYAPRETNQFVWDDLNAQLAVSAQGGEILNFSAREARANFRISAKGQWERERDLTASLTLTSDKGKRVFSVLGRQSHLSVEPL